MSLNLSGTGPVSPARVPIKVSASHPLIKLANRINWDAMQQVVAEDLKATTARGFWGLGYQYDDVPDEVDTALKGHRAGLEAIIGHIKHGGQLGKSRMKSDRTTQAAGYAALLGFNLRQLTRCLQRRLEFGHHALTKFSQ